MAITSLHRKCHHGDITVMVDGHIPITSLSRLGHNVTASQMSPWWHKCHDNNIGSTAKEGISLQWHYMSVMASQITKQLDFLFNGLFRLTTKQTSKLSITDHMWRESADYPHKGPVMRKAFPGHGVIVSVIVTKFTNTTIHLSHIPQNTIQIRNVYISVLNGALWDMGQVYCVICGFGL